MIELSNLSDAEVAFLMFSISKEIGVAHLDRKNTEYRQAGESLDAAITYEYNRRKLDWRMFSIDSN